MNDGIKTFTAPPRRNDRRFTIAIPAEQVQKPSFLTNLTDNIKMFSTIPEKKKVAFADTP